MPVLFAAAAGPVTGGERADRHVVLISIDGFPADLLNDPSAPVDTIRRLAEQGVAAECLTPAGEEQQDSR